MKTVFLSFILCFLLISCNGAGTQKKEKFSIEISPKSKEYQLNDVLDFDVSKNNFGEDISSVTYRINSKEISKTNGKYQLKNVKLGKQFLEAEVTTQSGKTHKIQKEIMILANQSPKIYTYKILNTYPHDKKSYTQGFEFLGDTILESTGQYGKSSLKKWNVFTGEVYKNINLNPQYFGEGTTAFNGKIIQLTWQENTGLIYDFDLKQTGSFKYGKSKEGWGICHDGKKFYKSDGSEKIWILNSETFEEEYFIQLCTDKSLFSNANELEWVGGKIYANTYQKDGIMIINPENGAIEGIIDVRGLKEKVEQIDELDVLNGIAYHSGRKTFFITGKNWSLVFEVIFEEK
ncbi:glutaminyl-peptide cyclotransferase [Capnocytophaga stomatis]|uniref:Glutamine cyclotransferase n=1 Tax=Capnocytophaga stomatis TaxID=1848904 RepID=A0A250G2N4_9FLAO|nr:glutaminyl-peptide cyclotransferase [Capnocytophaga stomatis]ATA90496.1 glutamine cyclotransferase [Capnocytophaga stomatis]